MEQLIPWRADESAGARAGSGDLWGAITPPGVERGDGA